MYRKTILLFVIVVALLACPAVAEAGLIAHWKLDDAASSTSVIDSSGNGRTAFATSGTPVLGVAGIAGTASSFADASFWLPANDPALAPTSFTYSYWLKADAGTTQWRTAASNRSGEDGFIFYRFNNGNRMEFWLKGPSGTGNWNAQLSPDITDFTRWYHVAGSYNSSDNSKKFYFHRDNEAWNAANIQTMTTGGNYHVTTQTVAIGARGAAGALPWGFGNAQLIDDVQYYDEMLSDAQVQFIFENPGVAIPEPSTFALAALGLLGLLACSRRRRR